MSFCIVTGLITNNKWKGYSIHPVVIAKAKKITYSEWTMREKVMNVQSKFKASVRNLEPETNEEMLGVIQEFFGGLE